MIGQEAARYPGEQAKVVKFFQENAMAAAQLRAPLYEDKVVDFLLSKAEVTERSVSRADLEAAIEDEDETPVAEKAPAKPKKAAKAKEAPVAEPVAETQPAPVKKAAKPKAAKAEAAEAPVEAPNEAPAKPKRATKKPG